MNRERSGLLPARAANSIHHRPSGYFQTRIAWSSTSASTPHLLRKSISFLASNTSDEDALRTVVNQHKTHLFFPFTSCSHFGMGPPGVSMAVIVKNRVSQNPIRMSISSPCHFARCARCGWPRVRVARSSSEFCGALPRQCG